MKNDDYEDTQDQIERAALEDTQNQEETEELREYREWVSDLFND